MIRAAAKSHRDVWVVVDPTDYDAVLAAIDRSDAEDEGLRRRLASKVFRHVSAYDQAIAGYLEDDGAETVLGEQLDVMNRHTAQFLGMRETLLGIAYAGEDALDGDAPHLTSEQRFQSVLVSLAAALVLYDNYLLGISIYEREPRLRRFLNERDEGYEIARNELRKISASYHSASRRRRGYAARTGR